MTINEFRKGYLVNKCREEGIIVEDDTVLGHIIALRNYYRGVRGYERKWYDDILDDMKSVQLARSTGQCSVGDLYNIFHSKNYVMQIWEQGERVLLVLGDGEYRVFSRDIDEDIFELKDITKNIRFSDEFINGVGGLGKRIICEVVLTTSGKAIGTVEYGFRDRSVVNTYINDYNELSIELQAKCPLKWNVLDVVYFDKDKRGLAFVDRIYYIERVRNILGKFGLEILPKDYRGTIYGKNKLDVYNTASRAGMVCWFRDLKAKYDSSGRRVKGFVKISPGFRIPVDDGSLNVYIGDIQRDAKGRVLKVSLFDKRDSSWVMDSKSIIEQLSDIRIGIECRIKRRGQVVKVLG